MGIEFKLNREQPQGRPDVAVLHLSGWLDAQSEARLVEAVQKAKDEGAKYVLLDLRDLDTITSAGIRAIQRAHEILTPKGSAVMSEHLKMCNAPPRVYEVLSITGLLRAVPTYEGIDIAIDSFGK